MNNPMNMMMQMLSMGNNPNTIIQQMLQQNPQLQVAINQMRTSGMSPQQYVTQLARQSGTDISPLINMINSRGMRF